MDEPTTIRNGTDYEALLDRLGDEVAARARWESEAAGVSPDTGFYADAFAELCPANRAELLLDYRTAAAVIAHGEAEPESYSASEAPLDADDRALYACAYTVLRRDAIDAARRAAHA